MQKYRWLLKSVMVSTLKSLISWKDQLIKGLKRLWLEVKWFVEDVIEEVKRR